MKTVNAIVAGLNGCCLACQLMAAQNLLARGPWAAGQESLLLGVPGLIQCAE